jgi:hypothetical protein
MPLHNVTGPMKRHIIKIPVVLALMLLVQTSIASGPRLLLTNNYQKDHLRKNLIPLEKYHPFPLASERGPWESVLPSLREEYISRGIDALDEEWPPLPATLFMAYKWSGERASYSRPYHKRRDRLRDLVIAECLEGEGRFLDEIVDGIWYICEESTWCIPIHLLIERSGSGLPDAEMVAADPGLPDVTDPIVDIFAGETANLMAWTFYLLGEQLDKKSPLIRERIQWEIRQRILDPLLERDDYWWLWTPGKEHTDHHINNWTPWIVSNWLTAALLMEDDQGRINTVYRCMEVLDRFLNVYHEDGGCDEGPGYFDRAGGATFDCLELLFDASGGTINLYGEPLIQNMAAYIYKAHIAHHYYTNFADASAILNIHPFHLFRFGQRINDEQLLGFTASVAGERDILNKGIGDNMGRQLYFLFNAAEITRQIPHIPLLQDVWLPGIQVMAAREKGGSIEGLYVAAKGGFNDESHNHNDAGHFIVYSDGQPAIIDVGVETYSTKTFSASRYDIWTMQSGYHNLPMVNGYMQPHGKEYKADILNYSSDPDQTQLIMDIAKAYPEEAGIQKWTRQINLDRKRKRIEVTDDYKLSKVTGDLQFALMTPCDVEIENHSLHLKGGLDKDSPVDLMVQFDQELSPKIETIQITDARLKAVWGDSLNRILLIDQIPGKQGRFRITISQ